MFEINVNDIVIKYEISPENLHIEDSYKIKDDETKREVIYTITNLHPEYSGRSEQSMLTEWKAHNILYNMDVAVDHTKDVDIEIHESWWRRLAYSIIAFFLAE